MMIHDFLDLDLFNIFPIADVKDFFDGSLKPFNNEYFVGEPHHRI